MTNMSPEPEPLPTRDGKYQFCDNDGPFCQMRNAFKQLFTISLSTQPDTIQHDKNNNPLPIIALSPLETSEMVKSILIAVRETEPQASLLHSLYPKYSLESSNYPKLKATVQLDALDGGPTHMVIINVSSPEESVPGITAVCQKSIYGGEVFQVTTDDDWIMRKYAIDNNWGSINNDVYFIQQTLKEIAKRRDPQMYNKLINAPPQ
jgi:hypothetical protein